jgi:hypothetical protein
LKEVGETLETYDEHFWRNGHAPTLVVFDDSSPSNREKHYARLEQTTTHLPVWYVGPSEKERFIGYLNQRLRDRRLESLVRNLFRPSYGGNRNFTLMYPLGGRHRLRPRRCGANPRQEQLHAQPAGGRHLQRRSGQPVQAQDQGQRDAPL